MTLPSFLPRFFFIRGPPQPRESFGMGPERINNYREICRLNLDFLQIFWWFLDRPGTSVPSRISSGIAETARRFVHVEALSPLPRIGIHGEETEIASILDRWGWHGTVLQAQGNLLIPIASIQPQSQFLRCRYPWPGMGFLLKFLHHTVSLCIHNCMSLSNKFEFTKSREFNVGNDLHCIGIAKAPHVVINRHFIPVGNMVARICWSLKRSHVC